MSCSSGEGADCAHLAEPAAQEYGGPRGGCGRWLSVFIFVRVFVFLFFFCIFVGFGCFFFFFVCVFPVSFGIF